MSDIWVMALDLVDVEPIPWWVYPVLIFTVTTLVAIVRLEILHYRSVQMGKLVPESTVVKLLAAKDIEIARMIGEVERWSAAFHISDSAYKELAQSIDDNTDAMKAVLQRARFEVTRSQDANGQRRR